MCNVKLKKKIPIYMEITNHGLRALTTSKERQELRAVGMTMPKYTEPIRLQYLNGSAKMGLRLWNVLSPKVDGYKYGPDSGVPTFSLDTLKQKGLLNANH